METKSERPSSSHSNHKRPVKKSPIQKKETRLIEIGWLNWNEKKQKYTQVRTVAGGGNRRQTINKSSKCSGVLELGKSLFFPNDVSPKSSNRRVNN